MDRYKVHRIASDKCYRILDTKTKKHRIVADDSGYRGVQRFKLRVEAEAKSAELNEMASGVGVSIPDIEAKRKENLVDEMIEQHPRQQIVLAALAGKVKCSAFDKEYRGHNRQTPPVGHHPLDAAPVHCIRIMRYINFSGENLTVDLICRNCAHTGMYAFDGNPLIDAGLVDDAIPF